MAERCQKVLDGFGMPAEWAVSIAFPIFMGKGNITNCSCYGAVMLLEHGMMVVERVLEERLCSIVSVGKTQVMISGGITEDGMSKSKLHPCVVCSMRVEANSVLCVECGK